MLKRYISPKLINNSSVVKKKAHKISSSSKVINFTNTLFNRRKWLSDKLNSINVKGKKHINVTKVLDIFNNRRSISAYIPKMKNPYGINFLAYMRSIKYRSIITDIPPSISPIPGKVPTGELIEHFVLSNSNTDNHLFILLGILLNVNKILKINFNIHFPNAPLCDGCIWVETRNKKKEMYALEIKNTIEMEETRCKVPINHSAKEVFDKYMKLVVIAVETTGNQKDKNLELTGNVMISIPYFDDFNECPRYEETYEDKSRELIWMNGYKFSSATFEHKFKF